MIYQRFDGLTVPAVPALLVVTYILNTDVVCARAKATELQGHDEGDACIDRVVA